MSTERWWWGCPASTFKLVLPAPAWRAAAAATEMHACISAGAGERQQGARTEERSIPDGDRRSHRASAYELKGPRRQMGRRAPRAGPATRRQRGIQGGEFNHPPPYRTRQRHQ
jgi:hypothetical protein